MLKRWIQTIRNKSLEPIKKSPGAEAIEEVAVWRKPESDLTLLSHRILSLIRDVQETIRTLIDLFNDCSSNKGSIVNVCDTLVTRCD